MAYDSAPSEARLRRLGEEIGDSGFELDGTEAWRHLVLVETDYALRPQVHERRVSSFGSIIEPRNEPTTWERGTQLALTRRPVGEMPLRGARRFADGMSSWLIRMLDGVDEWAVFDRPAGSERDLVVLSEVLDGTIVQRHPAGQVRIVGAFGVLRWNGLRWHHEPPVSTWIDSVATCPVHGDREVLETLLEFAVHDLGSRGIGATLVHRLGDEPSSGFETRLSVPPPLNILRPPDLTPLRHALSQVDGAAIFDADGTLRDLGVRLVPSADAEAIVESLRGMRHTSGRRYSYDDPQATVIVVSEDGPVTVVRNGEVVGRSPSAPM